MFRDGMVPVRVFAPDDQAGGLAAAAAAAGAAQGQQGAGGAQGAGAQGAQGGQGLVDPAAGGQAKGQQGTAGPYMPEGLAEAFKGKTDQETIDKLWAAQKALPKPPEKADAYTLTLPKTLEGVIDPKNDKVLPMFQQLAHKLGLSQAQYEGTIVGLYEQMAQAGMIEKPLDIKAEFAALGDGAGDPATKEQRGIQRVLDLKGKIDALATRQQIAPEMAKTLAGMMGTRETTVALEAILKLIPGEHGVQGGGQGGQVHDLADPVVRARLMYPNSQKRA